MIYYSAGFRPWQAQLKAPLVEGTVCGHRAALSDPLPKGGHGRTPGLREQKEHRGFSVLLSAYAAGWKFMSCAFAQVSALQPVGQLS